MNKHLFAILLVTLTVFTTWSCGDGSSSDSSSDEDTTSTKAYAMPDSTGTESECAAICKLPDSCSDPNVACASKDCWIPISCCHEIPKSTFDDMRLNPTGEGTQKERSEIESLLAACKDLRLYDASAASDTDITISSTGEEATVCYSYAMFKGILEQNPTRFDFFNAKDENIIFRVSFESGPDKYFDRSDTPPCK